MMVDDLRPESYNLRDGRLHPPKELALLVFAATGVVVFARALPDLVDTAIVVLLSGWTAEARPQVLAGALVRVVLGLTLFFRGVEGNA